MHFNALFTVVIAAHALNVCSEPALVANTQTLKMQGNTELLDIHAFFFSSDCSVIQLNLFIKLSFFSRLSSPSLLMLF